MGLTRNHLVSLLLYVIVVNEFRLPLVTCQDEDSTQCMPRTTFLALLRHPEASPSLAAYSRSGKASADAKSRNDMAHLKALAEDTDDAEICIPNRIYLQLLKDPIARGDLSFALNGRTQKLSDFLARLVNVNDPEDISLDEPREYHSKSQKRSIATLAKNDDLPISLHARIAENEDGEKRAITSREQSGQTDDLLSDEASLTRDFSMQKRNVGTLARDFALPPGRRNIASLVRDYEQNKSNRDRMLPLNGKRNVASLARTYTLPQGGKRNVASVAREYGLPYGKRYVGSLARAGDFPTREQRSVSSLAQHSAWPVSFKRGLSVPGSVIYRALSRQGRSMPDEMNAREELLALQELSNMEQDQDDDYYDAIDDMNDSWANIRRSKRQLSFSDEYPLPVMQNANVFDYEEMMEALDGQYPNTEKRFMGSAEETQPELGQLGYPETFRASKRHIGALARLGWLPTLRVARFSRSPRYLIGRENPADGPTSDYSADSTRSLRPNFNPRTRYVRASDEDCRRYCHGFKRFLILPPKDNNNYFHKNLPSSLLRSRSY
ncbi:neuropeptide-like 1 isoform X2 [Ceratina calcarata]|uniref:Neuropeptide-like 1 isoform X2 n=1 Tax=Ceratina calcarata TaxID=156304 RepID=A0AAJ7N3W7_9HYME|nr:neuropeptide-like 1 isoform X2 [Ceratina calcarata]